MTGDELLLAGIAWLASSVVMTGLWFVQCARRDATIVDAGWAAGLGMAAILYAVALPMATPLRRALVAGMVVLWSARLVTHLLRDRVARRVEDGRYANLRRRWGGRAQPLFFVFFQAQALLVALLSIPYVAAMRGGGGTFGATEVAAVAIWAASLAGESLADLQLASFRADPANRGRTCRTGLWRVSRHPNYFFEWLHWTAWPVLAAGSPHWSLALVGPALMLVLLLFVTGVPPAEARALETRGDDYRAYQRTTSAFFPWSPRASS